MSAPHSPSDDVRILRWVEVAARHDLEAALDEIFFESSATRSFADEQTREAFRDRWLGRYLAHDPQWAYVALATDGALAGYLVGAVDDPGTAPRFADLGFAKTFAPQTAIYPAHLHVNLAPQFRNRGLGGALIAAFAADAVRAGAPGMHVVTGANSRNVRFYEKNGFRDVARATLNGHEVVMLARRIPVAYER
jgi:GNAT superfamily N-acetyltransferase